MKTLNLIEGYLKHLLEQDVDIDDVQDVDDTLDQATEPEEPEVADDPAEVVDPAKRYIIKILVNAFLFDITKLAPDVQDRVRGEIDSIHNSINEPVAALVSRIKTIINMDRKLTIESKTSALMKYYLENTLDATEPQSQSDDQKSQASVTQGVSIPVDSRETVDINLVESFPAYSDLILQALSYTPDDQESRMVEDAVNVTGEDDPTVVIDVISSMLNSSEADTEVEDDLAKLSV